MASETVIVALAWALAVLLLLAVVLAFAVARLRAAISRLGVELATLRSQKQSQATRHGQTLEQFAPLVNWPWDGKQFRFLGSPIDGVQFNDDEVVFVEIKSGRSTLNAKQRQVRDLVQAGRVSWREVRL